MTKPDIDQASIALGKLRTILDLTAAWFNDHAVGLGKADATWLYFEDAANQHLAEVERALGIASSEDHDLAALARDLRELMIREDLMPKSAATVRQAREAMAGGAP